MDRQAVGYHRGSDGVLQAYESRGNSTSQVDLDIYQQRREDSKRAKAVIKALRTNRYEPATGVGIITNDSNSYLERSNRDRYTHSEQPKQQWGNSNDELHVTPDSGDNDSRDDSYYVHMQRNSRQRWHPSPSPTQVYCHPSRQRQEYFSSAPHFVSDSFYSEDHSEYRDDGEYDRRRKFEDDKRDIPSCFDDGHMTMQYHNGSKRPPMSQRSWYTRPSDTKTWGYRTKDKETMLVASENTDPMLHEPTHLAHRRKSFTPNKGFEKVELVTRDRLFQDLDKMVLPWIDKTKKLECEGNGSLTGMMIEPKIATSSVEKLVPSEVGWNNNAMNPFPQKEERSLCSQEVRELAVQARHGDNSSNKTESFGYPTLISIESDEFITNPRNYSSEKAIKSPHILTKLINCDDEKLRPKKDETLDERHNSKKLSLNSTAWLKLRGFFKKRIVKNGQVSELNEVQPEPTSSHAKKKRLLTFRKTSKMCHSIVHQREEQDQFDLVAPTGYRICENSRFSHGKKLSTGSQSRGGCESHDFVQPDEKCTQLEEADNEDQTEAELVENNSIYNRQLVIPPIETISKDNSREATPQPVKPDDYTSDNDDSSLVEPRTKSSESDETTVLTGSCESKNDDGWKKLKADFAEKPAPEMPSVGSIQCKDPEADPYRIVNSYGQQDKEKLTPCSSQATTTLDEIETGQCTHNSDQSSTSRQERKTLSTQSSISAFETSASPTTLGLAPREFETNTDFHSIEQKALISASLPNISNTKIENKVEDISKPKEQDKLLGDPLRETSGKKQKLSELQEAITNKNCSKSSSPTSKTNRRRKVKQSNSKANLKKRKQQRPGRHQINPFRSPISFLIAKKSKRSKALVTNKKKKSRHSHMHFDKNVSKRRQGKSGRFDFSKEEVSRPKTKSRSSAGDVKYENDPGKKGVTFSKDIALVHEFKAESESMTLDSRPNQKSAESGKIIVSSPGEMYPGKSRSSNIAQRMTQSPMLTHRLPGSMDAQTPKSRTHPGSTEPEVESGEGIELIAKRTKRGKNAVLIIKTTEKEHRRSNKASHELDVFIPRSQIQETSSDYQIQGNEENDRPSGLIKSSLSGESKKEFLSQVSDDDTANDSNAASSWSVFSDTSTYKDLDDAIFSWFMPRLEPKARVMKSRLKDSSTMNNDSPVESKEKVMKLREKKSRLMDSSTVIDDGLVIGCPVSKHSKRNSDTCRTIHTSTENA